MIFDYFDMLSGTSLLLDGVGHIRSPKLNELWQSSDVGQRLYGLYLNFFAWEKTDFVKYAKIMSMRNADLLNNEKLTSFDVVSLSKQVNELCVAASSFFLEEKLAWNAKNRCFVTYAKDDLEKKSPIGVICKENFERFRRAVLQMNFIRLDDDATPITHSCEESKRLWEKAQSFLEQQAKSDNKQNPLYSLGNIVSKVCAIHPSYNYFNIYNLTVFQLYDTFFQMGLLRKASLGERIFSNHGGETFKFEDWLEPILKIK